MSELVDVPSEWTAVPSVKLLVAVRLPEGKTSKMKKGFHGGYYHFDLTDKETMVLDHRHVWSLLRRCGDKLNGEFAVKARPETVAAERKKAEGLNWILDLIAKHVYPVNPWEKEAVHEPNA